MLPFDINTYITFASQMATNYELERTFYHILNGNIETKQQTI